MPAPVVTGVANTHTWYDTAWHAAWHTAWHGMSWSEWIRYSVSIQVNTSRGAQDRALSNVKVCFMYLSMISVAHNGHGNVINCWKMKKVFPCWCYHCSRHRRNGLTCSCSCVEMVIWVFAFQSRFRRRCSCIFPPNDSSYEIAWLNEKCIWPLMPGPWM